MAVVDVVQQPELLKSGAEFLQLSIGLLSDSLHFKLTEIWNLAGLLEGSRMALSMAVTCTLARLGDGLIEGSILASSGDDGCIRRDAFEWHVIFVTRSLF
ncbi:hypothetical protein CSKR_112675 [Clonorchis sinensis]|uniref:Uncharacterized protein n=1 Tax=Clonorchis sinensis TaxID=79923 RepID=A0A419QCL2_CLOSI|nr:hypothetical protein CSKR_112675 [Clonorchis sinensis]